jgi:hypothetical protein
MSFLEQQQTLLQSALWKHQPALEAWQAWRSQVDIETLDSDSYHLLSLLYPNLVWHHIDDPHMGRLKGVYRRTWLANQLLMQTVRSVLLDLQEANPLVLGEIALLTTCYGDYGQRPVYKLDVLVPGSQTLNAIATLQQRGWITHPYRPQPGDRLWTPMVFWQEKPNEPTVTIHLNLHNYLFRAEPQWFTDDQLWANAVTLGMHDCAASALSPVDQLLHLSLKSNEQPYPIYWLADAAMLIKTISQEADWVRLVTQAQRYEIVLPLRYLLFDVQAVLRLPIPDWVLPSLGKMAISYSELLDYNLRLDNKLLFLKATLLRLRQQWHTVSRARWTATP